MTRLCQARMDSSGHGDRGDRCGAHGRAAAWGVTYPMSHGRSVMKATLLSGILAATIALAAPAHADVDTDFANELHTYGIYGQRDYNAWLAKITCERLYKGVDTNAEKSAEFLSHNLPRGIQHRADLAIPRRNQHLLPRPATGPSRGRGTKPMTLRRICDANPCR